MVASGLVVGTTLVARPSATGSIRRVPPSEVVDDLLVRWETWRRAELSYTETSVRSSESADLTQRVEVAQRFPDLVVRDGDDISARVDGRLLGCAVVGGVTECVDNGSFRPDEELRLELDELRRLTSGPGAPYSLTRLGRSCFVLEHRGAGAFPERGDSERLCFDVATGVLSEEVRTVGGLTLTTGRSDVIPSVDPAVFDLPPSG